MAMICAPNKLGCNSSTRQAPQEPQGRPLTEVRDGCCGGSVKLCCDWLTALAQDRLKCQEVTSKCLCSRTAQESRFSGPTEVSHLWTHEGTQARPPACVNPFSSPPLLLSPSVLPIHECVREGHCLLAGCQDTGLIERSPESCCHSSLNPLLLFLPSMLHLSFPTQSKHPLISDSRGSISRFSSSSLSCVVNVSLAAFSSLIFTFSQPVSCFFPPDLPALSRFYQKQSMAGNPYPIIQPVPHPQNHESTR